MSGDIDNTLEQITDAYPLTPLQQGMLFHILSRPEQDQYLGHVTAMIHGPLTQEMVKTAWRSLIARHEALRTAFLWENLDHPMQVVHAHVPLRFNWLEVSNTPPHPIETALSIASAPLMHVTVTAEGPSRFKLDWRIHHLIADGWSVGVLLQEFLSVLNDAELSPAPAFAEHAEWLDNAVHEDDAPFWENYFTGHTASPLPNEGEGTGFASVQTTLKPATLAKASTSASTHKVTLGTVLQAAFARAVSQLSNSNDVLFGLASAGRSSPIEGVEQCVGLFVNTLPIRVDLSQSDVLKKLEETSLAVRSREHVPQSLLARYSGTPAGENMVQAVLSIRSLPNIQPVGDFNISDFNARTPSNFPLTLEVDPATGILTALYDRAALSHDRVAMFLSTFDAALSENAVQAKTNRHLSGPVFATPPVDMLEQFIQTVARVPLAIAVSDDQTALTFEELNTRANTIGANLIANGVLPGDRVALVLPRCVDFVAAFLGALIAGAAYVPVDTSYPSARIAAILQDCLPKVVLREEDLVDIPSMPRVEPIEVHPSNPAYIIYTSGSTGTPKGVEISRGSLAASQAARDTFYPDIPEAFLLLSPFAFDSSIVGIYWALCSGANLVIAHEGAEQDMAALGNLIQTQHVTHTLMLPTLYDALLSAADPAKLQGLRQVIVAGEACLTALPARHATLLPHCAFANEYGPTEATVWATADLNLAGVSAKVTIGRPICGMHVLLLDQQRNPVPVGEIGQIALAGPSLATGYFNRAAETANAFPQLQTPDGSTQRIYLTGDRARLLIDGRLQYLGRGDRQVKIRGHRIEMDEVEAAICELDFVSDASIIAIPARSADQAVLQAALNQLPPDEAAALITKAGGVL